MASQSHIKLDFKIFYPLKKTKIMQIRKIPKVSKNKYLLEIIAIQDENFELKSGTKNSIFKN